MTYRKKKKKKETIHSKANASPLAAQPCLLATPVSGE
jgi:hypothetical protein